MLAPGVVRGVEEPKLVEAISVVIGKVYGSHVVEFRLLSCLE